MQLQHLLIVLANSWAGGAVCGVK